MMMSRAVIHEPAPTDEWPADIICTLSGGFDSAAAMLLALEQGPTRALFVNYGQRYLTQEQAALKYLTTTCAPITQHKNWRGLWVARVPLGLMGRDDRWVPYRNLVLAAVATNWATAWGCDAVVFGSKSEEYRPNDPVSYYDSTKQFYQRLHALVEDNTEPHRKGGVPDFILPLVGWDKATVIQLLVKHGVDVHKLWNCYREDGEPTPCGECEHCVSTRPLIEQITGQAVGRRDDRRDHDRHPPRTL